MTPTWGNICEKRKKIKTVIKVLEKFGLYRNGLFLLEHPFGWKVLLLLWLEMFYFINGIRALTFKTEISYWWLNFILLCYGWSQIKQIHIQVRFIFFRRWLGFDVLCIVEHCVWFLLTWSLCLSYVEWRRWT